MGILQVIRVEDATTFIVRVIPTGDNSSSEANKFLQFKKENNDLAETLEPLGSQVLPSNTTLLVKNEKFNGWERGILLTNFKQCPNKPIVQVYLVDYDETVKVNLQNARVANSAILSFPYQAKTFNIVGVVPFGNNCLRINNTLKWDQNANEFVSNLLPVGSPVKATLDQETIDSEGVLKGQIMITYDGKKITLSQLLINEGYGQAISTIEDSNLAQSSIENKLSTKSFSSLFSHSLSPGLHLENQFSMSKKPITIAQSINLDNFKMPLNSTRFKGTQIVKTKRSKDCNKSEDLPKETHSSKTSITNKLPFNKEISLKPKIDDSHQSLGIECSQTSEKELYKVSGRLSYKVTSKKQFQLLRNDLEYIEKMRKLENDSDSPQQNHDEEQAYQESVKQQYQTSKNDIGHAEKMRKLENESDNSEPDQEQAHPLSRNDLDYIEKMRKLENDSDSLQPNHDVEQAYQVSMKKQYQTSKNDFGHAEKIRKFENEYENTKPNQEQAPTLSRKKQYQTSKNDLDYFEKMRKLENESDSLQPNHNEEPASQESVKIHYQTSKNDFGHAGKIRKLENESDSPQPNHDEEQESVKKQYQTSKNDFGHAEKMRKLENESDSPQPNHDEEQASQESVKKQYQISKNDFGHAEKIRKLENEYGNSEPDHEQVHPLSRKKQYQTSTNDFDHAEKMRKLENECDSPQLNHDEEQAFQVSMKKQYQTSKYDFGHAEKLRKLENESDYSEPEQAHTLSRKKQYQTSDLDYIEKMRKLENESDSLEPNHNEEQVYQVSMKKQYHTSKNDFDHAEKLRKLENESDSHLPNHDKEQFYLASRKKQYRTSSNDLDYAEKMRKAENEYDNSEPNQGKEQAYQASRAKLYWTSSNDLDYIKKKRKLENKSESHKSNQDEEQVNQASRKKQCQTSKNDLDYIEMMKKFENDSDYSEPNQNEEPEALSIGYQEKNKNLKKLVAEVKKPSINALLSVSSTSKTLSHDIINKISKRSHQKLECDFISEEDNLKFDNVYDNEESNQGMEEQSSSHIEEQTFKKLITEIEVSSNNANLTVPCTTSIKPFQRAETENLKSTAKFESLCDKKETHSQRTSSKNILQTNKEVIVEPKIVKSTQTLDFNVTNAEIKLENKSKSGRFNVNKKVEKQIISERDEIGTLQSMQLIEENNLNDSEEIVPSMKLSQSVQSVNLEGLYDKKGTLSMQSPVLNHLKSKKEKNIDNVSILRDSKSKQVIKQFPTPHKYQRKLKIDLHQKEHKTKMKDSSSDSDLIHPDTPTLNFTSPEKIKRSQTAKKGKNLENFDKFIGNQKIYSSPRIASANLKDTNYKFVSQSHKASTNLGRTTTFLDQIKYISSKPKEEIHSLSKLNRISKEHKAAYKQAAPKMASSLNPAIVKPNMELRTNAKKLLGITSKDYSHNSSEFAANQKCELQAPISDLIKIEDSYSLSSSGVLHDHISYVPSSNSEDEILFQNDPCLAHEFQSPFPIYTVTTKKLKCVDDLYDIPFHSAIKNRMRENNFSKVSRIQSFMWPSILRKLNMICIGGPKVGKSFGYLVPIFSFLSSMELYKNVPQGYGPYALILCSSWKGVIKLETQLKSFLGPLFEELRILFLYDGQHTMDDEKMIFWENGMYVVISTPEVFLRETSKEKRFAHIYNRCCHFILEDADELFKLYPESTKAILATYYRYGKNRKENLPTQFIITSKSWMPFFFNMIEIYMKDDVQLFFTSYFEAAIYNHCNITFNVTSDEQLDDELTAYLEKVPLGKKVICVNDPKSCKSVQRHLLRKEIATYIAHEEIKLENTLREQIENFKRKQNAILIVSDRILLSTHIKDANILIHYDMPESFDIFENRFIVILNNLHRNSLNKYISRCCHFMTNKHGVAALTIHRILMRMNRLIPKSLSQLRKSYFNATRITRPLCPFMKAIAICNNRTCPYRHFIDANLDKPVLEFKIHEDIKFTVTYYVNCTHFYIRPITWNKKADMLDKKLLDYLLSIDCFSNNSIEPIVESIYVAKLNEMDLFRVKVLEIVSDDQIIVCDIDKGQIHTVAISNLYDMTAELSLIQPLAIEAFISNIRPLDLSYEWTPAANKFIQDLIGDKELEGRITLYIGSTLWMSPIVYRVKDSLTKKYHIIFNIKSELIKQGLGKDNQEHINELRKYCDNNFEFEFEAHKISYQHAFLEDDFVEVTVPLIVHMNLFYVNIKKFESCLRDIQRDIAKLIESGYDKKLTHYAPDIPALARFSGDDNWHRVRIQKEISLSEVQIFYGDFGELAKVKKKELLSIPQELLDRAPFQAIECSLFGIEFKDPLNEELREDFYNFVHNADNSLKIIIVKPMEQREKGIDSAGKHSVISLYGQEHSDVSFAEYLLAQQTESWQEGGSQLLWSNISPETPEIVNVSREEENSYLKLFDKVINKKDYSNESDESSKEELYKPVQTTTIASIEDAASYTTAYYMNSPQSGKMESFSAICERVKLSWWQDESTIHLNLQVANFSECESLFEIEENYLKYESHSQQLYMEFFSTIDVAKIETFYKELYATINLTKYSKKTWQRLTKSKEKNPFIQLDVDHYYDSEEDQQFQGNLYQRSSADNTITELVGPDEFDTDTEDDIEFTEKPILEAFADNKYDY